MTPEQIPEWLLNTEAGIRCLRQTTPAKIRSAMRHEYVRLLAIQHPHSIELVSSGNIVFHHICQLNIDEFLGREMLEETLPPAWLEVLRNPKFRFEIGPRAIPKDGRQFGGTNY